jgi:hypothetical protein
MKSMKNHKSLISILMIVFCSLSEVIVGGIINSDTKWNAEDGPYIVERDLLITSSAQLTINPGTKIFIRNHPLPDTTIYQLNHVDSTTVSIKVEGILICLGRRDQRISFSPLNFLPDKYCWYGIVFLNDEEALNELTCTDIVGAYSAVSAFSSNPQIRLSILEYNHIGISCFNKSNATIYNCVIARNFASGILVSGSNPRFVNNIIVFNRNHGLLCDGISKVYLEYNCFYGNHDGNFLECDPEFGVIVKANKRKDSTDVYNNIFTDPVFAGSVSDSLATERDYNLPTLKSRVKDTALAEIIYEGKSLPESIWKNSKAKYQLSRYSPCINAGHPGDNYKDIDGSRNDMGISGGPEFVSRRSKKR